MYGTTLFPVAVHAMTSIAVLTEKYGHPTAPAVTIARSINTNPVVVRRLLARLRRARLVRTMRGQEGGYGLARPAATITLADVLAALGDERVFRLHPKRGVRSCEVSRSLPGALAPVLDEAEAALRDRLGRVTLGSLVARMR